MPHDAFFVQYIQYIDLSFYILVGTGRATDLQKILIFFAVVSHSLQISRGLLPLASSFMAKFTTNLFIHSYEFLVR